MDRPRTQSARAWAAAATLSLLLAASELRAQDVRSTTPNEFLKRGTPTFVLGTAGDDQSDRAIEAQVDLIRSLLFPAARVVLDDSIEFKRGASAWPPNPVLYGGPHVNRVLAGLRPSLPFNLERGKLVLGTEVFEGEEHRLIAVVPARGADADGPGYPQFLLYAGAGSPGVAEINAVSHGSEPLLVADTFGRLVAGQWVGGSGGVRPQLTTPRARRIPWRAVDRELRGLGGGAHTIMHCLFPKQLAPAEDEPQVIEACERGLAATIRKLEITEPTPVWVYIYPDRGSKRSLTGNPGDGHAVISSRAVHVVRPSPLAAGGLEHLVAHEGAHVLSYDAWGPPRTPFLGEGLAVWSSGSYGGVSLEEWASRLRRGVPPLAGLLGPAFRQMPEQESYPLAGLFIEVAVQRVGLQNVREHLLGATATTWSEACERAGTTPEELEANLRERLSGG